MICDDDLQEAREQARADARRFVVEAIRKIRALRDGSGGEWDAALDSAARDVLDTFKATEHGQRERRRFARISASLRVPFADAS